MRATTGFAVPEAVLQKALERLNEDLLTGSAPFYGYDHREHLRFAYQAHAGYVLARVNRAPLGTLRALYDNEREQGAHAACRCCTWASRWTLQGDKARGAQGDRRRLSRRRTSARTTSATTAPTARRGADGDAGARARAAPSRSSTRACVALVEGARRAPQRHAGSGYSTQEQIALARLGKSLMLDRPSARSAARSQVGETTSRSPSSRMFGRRLRLRRTRAGRALRRQDRAAAVRHRGRRRHPAQCARSPTPASSASAAATTTPTATLWKGGVLKEGDSLDRRAQGGARRDDARRAGRRPAAGRPGSREPQPNAAEQWADITVDGVALADRDERRRNLVHEEYRDDRYVAALKLDGSDRRNCSTWCAR